MNNEQPTMESGGQPIAPQPPELHRVRKIALFVVGGVVVAALAAGGYWFFLGRAQREVAVLPEEIPSVPEEVPYVDPFPDDADRDGITDAEEAALGTSHLEYDTDGDGVSDVDEIDFWKTSPTNADTDGDGFGDGWEIIQGFNPNGAGRLE